MWPAAVRKSPLLRKFAVARHWRWACAKGAPFQYQQTAQASGGRILRDKRLGRRQYSLLTRRNGETGRYWRPAVPLPPIVSYEHGRHRSVTYLPVVGTGSLRGQ